MTEEVEELHLQFQAGCSRKAHKILKKISGIDDEEKDDENLTNEKAPFDKMNEAYMFALMLGLSRGQKKGWKKRVNYANFGQTVAKKVDIISIMKHIGLPEDVENQDAMQTAIQEYATWGLEQLGESKYGDDDYRIFDLLNNSED